MIGFLLMTVSVLPFAVIREPVGQPRSEDDPHTGHYGRDSRRVWRTNDGFRRFLYGQVVLTLSMLAVPFYVLYAQRHLRAGTDAVAGYTATLVLVASFGGLGWGYGSDHFGNRSILLASCACAALASVFALFAPTPLLFFGVFALLRSPRRAWASPETTS